MKRILLILIVAIVLEPWIVASQDTLTVKLHRVPTNKAMKKRRLMRLKRRVDRRQLVRQVRQVKGRRFLRAKHHHSKSKTSLGIRRSMKYLKNKIKFYDELATAKIDLTNYADIQFYGEIGLGEKKDKFKVLFDTGSSWTWLPSHSCKGCKEAGIDTHYDCTVSKSCVNHGTNVEIEYGLGKIKGEISTDSFFFNGKEMKDQPFLMVEDINDQMPELEFSGLVGLSPSDHMTSEYTSFLKNMKDHKLIKKQSFAVYLSRESDKKNTPEVMFGGFDKAKSKGDFKYCDVTAKDYWNIGFEGISTGKKGKKLSLSTKEGLLDTGTSVITFGSKDFPSILNKFKGYDSSCFVNEDEMEIGCPGLKGIEELPSLTFHLCNKEFTMAPSDYAHMYQTEKEKTPIPYLKFAKLDIGNGIAILGDPFLQAFYTYYDNHEMKVAISSANHG